MVEIGDKVLINQKPDGEIIATEIGSSPDVGDIVFVNRMPNGELITNGVSSCDIGDTIMVKPLKDYLNRDVCLCAEHGGDDTCLRGVYPTCTKHHSDHPTIFAINGGWSSYFKIDPPMYVEAWQPFPLMYITTYNRTAIVGEGSPPITDDEGNIISEEHGDFQNWYPWGRMRFMFSTDGLPFECGEKAWFCTDDLPPSILEIGDITLNQRQDTYVYPDYRYGRWVWREGRYITDIWIHIRNTSSFAWNAHSTAKVSKLRICYQSHPNYENEGMGSANLLSPEWTDCMIQGAEEHPEMTDTELMNFCTQYL